MGMGSGRESREIGKSIRKAQKYIKSYLKNKIEYWDMKFLMLYVEDMFFYLINEYGIEFTRTEFKSVFRNVILETGLEKETDRFDEYFENTMATIFAYVDDIFVFEDVYRNFMYSTPFDTMGRRFYSPLEPYENIDEYLADRKDPFEILVRGDIFIAGRKGIFIPDEDNASYITDECRWIVLDDISQVKWHEIIAFNDSYCYDLKDRNDYISKLDYINRYIDKDLYRKINLDSDYGSKVEFLEAHSNSVESELILTKTSGNKDIVLPFQPDMWQIWNLVDRMEALRVDKKLYDEMIKIINDFLYRLENGDNQSELDDDSYNVNPEFYNIVKKPADRILYGSVYSNLKTMGIEYDYNPEKYSIHRIIELIFHIERKTVDMCVDRYGFDIFIKDNDGFSVYDENIMYALINTVMLSESDSFISMVFNIVKSSIVYIDRYDLKIDSYNTVPIRIIRTVYGSRIKILYEYADEIYKNSGIGLSLENFEDFAAPEYSILGEEGIFNENGYLKLYGRFLLLEELNRFIESGIYIGDDYISLNYMQKAEAYLQNPYSEEYKIISNIVERKEFLYLLKPIYYKEICKIYLNPDICPLLSYNEAELDKIVKQRKGSYFRENLHNESSYYTINRRKLEDGFEYMKKNKLLKGDSEDENRYIFGIMVRAIAVDYIEKFWKFYYRDMLDISIRDRDFDRYIEQYLKNRYSVGTNYITLGCITVHLIREHIIKTGYNNEYWFSFNYLERMLDEKIGIKNKSDEILFELYNQNRDSYEDNDEVISKIESLRPHLETDE